MNNAEKYNELKALHNKAFNLSKTDKKLIKELSSELGLEFIPREKCQDCYRDQIVILMIELKKTLTVEENSSCAYEMVNDKSIKWASFIINNATLTNELAEQFKSKCRNWKQFIKLKE